MVSLSSSFAFAFSMTAVPDAHGRVGAQGTRARARQRQETGELPRARANRAAARCRAQRKAHQLDAQKLSTIL